MLLTVVSTNVCENLSTMVCENLVSNGPCAYLRDVISPFLAWPGQGHVVHRTRTESDNGPGCTMLELDDRFVNSPPVPGRTVSHVA